MIEFCRVATIQKFEDLLCWKKARQLHALIYERAIVPPFSKDYEHKDQILASSGSAMDLIAEGYGRYGNKEFIHFLTMASGSLCETKSQLYRAFDKKFLSKEEFEVMICLAAGTHNLIVALFHKLKQSDLKGRKFI